MSNESLKVVVKEFKKACEKKGWAYEDAYAIAICVESRQAIELFGSKEAAYNYVLSAITKYDNARVFLDHFSRILIPAEE